MRKEEFSIFNFIDKLINDVKNENIEICSQVNKCFYYNEETANNQEMREMFNFILERDRNLLEIIYQMNIDQMLLWAILKLVFEDDTLKKSKELYKKIIEEKQLKKDIEEKLKEERKKEKKEKELLDKKLEEEWKAEKDKEWKEKIAKMKEESKR